MTCTKVEINVFVAAVVTFSVGPDPPGCFLIDRDPGVEVHRKVHGAECASGRESRPNEGNVE